MIALCNHECNRMAVQLLLWFIGELKIRVEKSYSFSTFSFCN